MKKAVSALLMALLSCALLLGWRWYQNRVPELEDIFTLDPTQYQVTHTLQDFKLKPHDRQWTLKSITSYDKNGQVTQEEHYQLDEDGQSYYIAENGERVDSLRMPRLGFRNITGFLAEWDIRQEDYDDAGRIIYRDASFDCLRALVRWYYCPDQPDSSDDSAISTLVEILHAKFPKNHKIYGPEEESYVESTGYVISLYDRYGNEMILSTMENECYIKTDADGYLQMIVMRSSIPPFSVYRVDEYGRPLWLANYDQEGNLTGYTVWEYEDLS